MIRSGEATHVGCATDHVIRSFRNQLYPGYKTEAGVPPDLLAQFTPIEEVLAAAGFVVWPMVEFEADDALATAAARYREACPVVIASPDKDLAQCVVGDRVVLLDRMRSKVTDEAGVLAKWGVPPATMPDWLALVGDSADGYPGIPGWGARSSSTVLAAHGRIEDIPDQAAAWQVKPRGAERLARSLAERRPEALLYKRLATLRTDAPVDEPLEALEWRGATPRLRELAAELGFDDVAERVPRWR
jgi:5'-3' exonuclease